MRSQRDAWTVGVPIDRFDEEQNVIPALQPAPVPGILILNNTANLASVRPDSGGPAIPMTFDPIGSLTCAGVKAAYDYYAPLSGGVSGVLHINPQGILENGFLHVVTP